MGEPAVISALPLAAGAFEAITGSQIVMLAFGVVGLTLLLVSTRRRVRRSQQSSGIPVRERYESLQQEAPAVRAVEAVMRELDELSREIHGRLDTQLAKLEVVIRDADERIDRLTRITRGVDGSETVDVTLDRELPSTNRLKRVINGDSAHADVYQLADKGRSTVEIATELGRTAGEVELILSLRKTKQPAISPPTPSRVL